MASSPTNKHTIAQALINVSVNGNRESLGELATTNSSLMAMATKLIPSAFPQQRDARGNNKVTVPRLDSVAAVSQSISRKRADAQAIQEIFPDVRLAIEIFLVMVISPNDMFTEEMNYEVDNNLYCRPFIQGLTGLVSKYFEKDYPLLDKFYDILKESAFTSGCSPTMVLPESSLDELIHGGPAVVERKMKSATESARIFGNILAEGGQVKTLGHLGAPGGEAGDKGEFRFSLESYARVASGPINIDVNVKAPGVGLPMYCAVHDNPEIIKLGRVQAMMRNQKQRELANRVYNKSTFALESQVLNDAKLSSLLFSSGSANAEPMMRIRSLSETSRETIGECLRIDLPPESVIPLVVVGSPRKRVAYLVAIDQSGYAIRSTDNVDNFDKMRLKSYSQAGGGMNQDMTSFMLDKARQNFGNGCTDPTMAQAAQIYGEIIDADVLSRIRNGVLGSEVVISNAENVYRVMFARALQKRHTQLLYVPEEMLTYFAYDINPDGTGKSLLEEIRSMAALRAQMLYARTMGATKNSIGRTKATITIDGEDTDRLGTIEALRADIIASRSILNTGNTLIPADIQTQLSAGGVEIAFDGEGAVPGTNVKFDEIQSNYSKPDQELDEYLTDSLISGVGVPPELVADAKRVEFATIATSSNKLLAKRVRNVQKRFEPELTHHARACLRSDGNIMKKMVEFVKANIKLIKDDPNAPAQLRDAENDDLVVRLLVSEYISNLELKLNKPNMLTRQAQLEAMNQFGEGVDFALDAILSDDKLDASLIGAETKAKLKSFGAMAKTILTNREMQRTGFMPEVLDLFTMDAEKNLMGDITQEAVGMVSNMSKAMRGLFEALAKVQAGADQDLQKIQVPESDSSGVSYDGGGTSTPSTSTPSSDLDMGLGPDAPMDETPPDTPDGGGDSFEVPLS